MVLIEESGNDAEANIAVPGTGAAAQQRVVPKRSLNYVINFAYVYHQAEKILAPCGTVQSITELAAHLSTHMQLVVPRQQLVVPRQQLVEPPPAQKLRFTKEIPAEIFTNDTIDLKIELVNIESGLICSTGEPASPLKVEIFITTGSFPSKDRKLRKCKPLCPRNKATMPLLVQVTGTKTARRGCSFKNKSVSELRNGRAVVKVKITDNSSWVRSKMFKLVARVVKGSYQGRRIKEALSEAFAVKEAKLKGKKADVPSPTDPTSKLNNVGKKYCKILQDMGINTVHDFLNKLESDPEGLKAKLGMQNTKWESTVDHARQCKVSPEQEPSMTETNEETFAPGQDINVQQEPNITDLPHTPEIQAQYKVMGQQRDFFEGEVFGEMPEQASTSQGMTGSNLNQGLISNFARLESSNQWNYPYFYAESPPNDDQPLWNFS
ncbi:uncharacterized protein LOC144548169 [Carex rostrata]